MLKHMKRFGAAWAAAAVVATSGCALAQNDDGPGGGGREDEAGRVIEASFASAVEDAVVLSGELTLPPGAGPFPGVVLLSGSGPQDRDGADADLGAHRPYLAWAQALTARGYAVLRFDDRGVGASSGDFETATVADFAQDARAALAYLRAREHVDPARVGLLGHSEGGVVAALAGVDAAPSFVVIASGTAVSLEAAYREQYRMQQTIVGDTSEAIEANQAILAAVFDALTHTRAADAEQARAAVAAVFDEFNIPYEAGLEPLTAPSWRYLAALDIPGAVATVNAPVLALFGARDTQISAEQNAPAFEAIFEARARSGDEVIVLDGLNHLFQPAETGLSDEYAGIETTLDPRAPDAVAAWLDRTLRQD